MEAHKKNILRLDRGQIEVVEDAVAEILRCKTPAERIRIAFDLWTSTHDMLMTHLKNTHPEWSHKRVNQEVARRLFSGTPEEFERAVKSCSL